MEAKHPKSSSVSVEEKDWLETLRQWLAADAQRTLWVSLHGGGMRLSAMPYQLQVDERRIRLIVPRLSPAGSVSPLFGLVLDFPAPGCGAYEKQTDEKGNVRLRVSYRLRREGDPPDRDHLLATLVIATDDGFLADKAIESHVL
jgi:hypothetical protein